jgi:sigma-B regulation protein RsbU (phosphoserine phosphatase)
MTAISFSQILASPLLARLLVLACAAAVFLVVRRKDTEGQAGAFIATIGLLVVRDILVILFPIPELQNLSDVFYFGFALFVFLAPFKRSRVPLIAAIVVHVAITGLYLATIFSGLATIPAWGIGALLVADAAFMVLMGLLNNRDSEAGGRHIVSDSWIFSSTVLMMYAVLSLVLGHGNAAFEWLVVPVSYGWLVTAGLVGLSILDQQTLAAVSYYEAAIDSLYNLSFRVGTVLKGSFSTEDVIESMNDVIIEETGADGGSIYLVDEFDDVIIAKALSGNFPPPFLLPESLPRKQNRIESFMRHAQFRLGETVLGEVAKTGKNIYAPDVTVDGRFPTNGEEDFLRLSSFMAVPLMVEDKIIGVSAVAKSRPGSPFGEADFDRLKLLANFGTLAVSNFFSFLEANERNSIEQTAGIAAEIQRTIIPKKLPQFQTLAIGAYSSPARGVSGDYYDLIRIREDKLVGVIGDVAGKGVSAALIMVMIRSILHLITNTNRDMATVLDWVNKGIAGKIDMDHYATLGLIAINIVTGELEYANASHQPLLIYHRASDMVETIEMKSVPIGVERSTTYQRKAFRLYDGDIAVLYTDGIVEVLNEQGKQFGRKNLSQLIARHKDLSPKEIVGRIKQEVSKFIGTARQHDDQTVLVFKMKL